MTEDSKQLEIFKLRKELSAKERGFDSVGEMIECDETGIDPREKPKKKATK